MKKFFQLFLFFLLILIVIIFYINYIKTNPKKVGEEKKEETLIENQNNLITNLRYNVSFDNNTEYFITAELSEIFYQEGSEFVEMQIVFARIVNEENIPLVIESNNAIYNNSNYNTQFSNDVKVTYLGSIINSENLDLNFEENIVTVYNNVIYEGVQGQLRADNIVINLITKEINVFMNDAKDKVIVKSE